jgi:acetyl esterase/lipase
LCCEAVDPLIHKEYLCELADAYLPAGIGRKDPRISPLYADLRGFPPTLIQVGSAETLLDDATRFSEGGNGRRAPRPRTQVPGRRAANSRDHTKQQTPRDRGTLSRITISGIRWK